MTNIETGDESGADPLSPRSARYYNSAHMAKKTVKISLATKFRVVFTGFMGGGNPALAEISRVTGDRKYLDLANRLWWKTTEYLYDKDDKLYFRDSRFFEQREPAEQRTGKQRHGGAPREGAGVGHDEEPRAQRRPPSGRITC